MRAGDEHRVGLRSLRLLGQRDAVSLSLSLAAREPRCVQFLGCEHDLFSCPLRCGLVSFASETRVRDVRSVMPQAVFSEMLLCDVCDCEGCRLGRSRRPPSTKRSEVDETIDVISAIVFIGQAMLALVRALRYVSFLLLNAAGCRATRFFWHLTTRRHSTTLKASRSGAAALEILLGDPAGVQTRPAACAASC